MAMKEYEVSSYGYYCYELAEDLGGYAKGVFGVSPDSGGWTIIMEDLNEILEESDEFIQAATEAGFDTSFNELEPYEVYEKIFGTDIEEDMFYSFCDYDASNYYDEIEGILYTEVEDARSYLIDLRNKEIINEINAVREDDDPFIITGKIECDEKIAEEIQAHFDNLYRTAAKKAEEIEIIHAYEEPEFGIPFFKVKFRGFDDAQVINLKEV